MTQVYNPSEIDIKMSGTAGGANHNKIYIWSDIVTPTTGNGFTFSIAEAAFTTVTNIQLTPQLNTASVVNMPFLNIKSYTNTSVTVNILTSASTTVSLLGAVVQGLTFATNLTGCTIHCRVEGY